MSMPGNGLRRWSDHLPNGAPAWLADPFVQCLIAIGILSAIFVAFPALDVWFSGLFYQPGNGFPVGSLPAFIGIRSLHALMTWVIAVGMALALVYKILLPWRPTLVPIRNIIFILGTLAIGPGIVVNALFKSFSGRPRPYATYVFGGDLPFVGAWHFTDYCASNCSFISGESSSGVWLVTAAVLVPERWRPLAVRILLALGAVFAVNRIAFGAHFLSDVLIAWFVTLAIIVLFWRYLYVSPPAALREEKLEADVTAFGEALRRPFSRTKP